MNKFYLIFFIGLINCISALGNQSEQTKQDTVITQAFSGTSNIWLKNGNLYRGYGFSVEQDSISLFTMVRKQRFNKNQITKIQIESEQKSYSNGFAGLFLGVLLGNILFFHEEHDPTAYLDTETDNIFYWLLNIVFAGVGAGAGYLVDIASDRSLEFDLLTDTNNWQKLKNLQLRKQNFFSKWHFSIQSAWIFPRIKNIYEKPLKEQGYSFSEFYYSRASKFNLLRKIQLTYSINQNFEVGAAAFWQGERSLFAYSHDYPTVRFSNDVTGYYAVGMYNLLSLQSTKLINLKLGLALGLANVKFKIDKSNWYYGNNDNFFHQINKTLYSQIVFTELLFKPIHGISLGLTADYSETPAQKIPEIPLTSSAQIIPEIPQTSIKSKKISFGNSSVGFLLRLNF